MHKQRIRALAGKDFQEAIKRSVDPKETELLLKKIEELNELEKASKQKLENPREEKMKKKTPRRLNAACLNAALRLAPRQFSARIL